MKWAEAYAGRWEYDVDGIEYEGQDDVKRDLDECSLEEFVTRWKMPYEHDDGTITIKERVKKHSWVSDVTYFKFVRNITRLSCTNVTLATTRVYP